MFEEYLYRWGLTPDGQPIVTRTSRLLPVRREGAPAMLKVAMDDEERVGGMLMVWWEGRGAAPILTCDNAAILLERADGKASLTEMARLGQDEDASRIICAVLAQLHTPKTKPLPRLLPLTEWFAELESAAAAHGGNTHCVRHCGS